MTGGPLLGSESLAARSSTRSTLTTVGNYTSGSVYRTRILPQTYGEEEEHLLGFLHVQVGPLRKLLSPGKAVGIDLGIERRS